MPGVLGFYVWTHITSIKKAPKGSSESPWSLHIRSFGKIHFINPPEEQGQVVGLLISWKENGDAKV
jgi:hypothetical protein